MPLTTVEQRTEKVLGIAFRSLSLNYDTATLLVVITVSSSALPSLTDGTMSTRRSMTRDIHESIRLALGAKAKILLKCPVKQDSGGGVKAGSDRILVFTAHRYDIYNS